MGINYFFEVFRKYADFNSKARRKEFWFFRLYSTVALILAAFLDTFLGTTLGSEGVGMFYIGFVLLSIIPTFAVSFRRMHDVGKNGVFVFIPLYNLVLFLTDSEYGENGWGENPKGIGNEEDDETQIQNIGQ